MNFPDEALLVLHRLEDAGYEAWIVGGAVRDGLMGNTASDIDLATNATPEQIENVFFAEHTLDVGKSFGTIRVVMPKAVYEVTTFRAERDYRDGRHPQEVRYSQHLEEDLKRRDFTMNAMAWHPKRGLRDPFGGERDLRQGLLRAVGCAEERIAEDALRMLRAVRFASRFQWTMESSLKETIQAQHERIRFVSIERCYEELERMLTGKHPDQALVLLEETELWVSLFGEQSEKGKEMSLSLNEVCMPFLCALPPIPALRWAVLGFGCSFASSDEEAARRMARIDGILRRLKTSTRLREEVRLLLREAYRPLPETLADTKRLMGRTKPLHHDLLTFLHAASETLPISSQEREKRLSTVLRVEKEIHFVEEHHLPVEQKDLALGGADLLAMGMKPGKPVGEMLSWLLEQVIDGNVKNEASVLAGAVRQKREEGERE